MSPCLLPAARHWAPPSRCPAHGARRASGRRRSFRPCGAAISSAPCALTPVSRVWGIGTYGESRYARRLGKRLSFDDSVHCARGVCGILYFFCFCCFDGWHGNHHAVFPMLKVQRGEWLQERMRRVCSFLSPLDTAPWGKERGLVRGTPLRASCCVPIGCSPFPHSVSWKLPDKPTNE